MRAVTLWMAIGFALSAAACSRWEPSGGDQGQVGGRLTADAIKTPSAVYELGAFRVRWEAEQGGRLVIAHASEPERALWASLPGRGFLAAGIGREEVREERASFFFDERREVVCDRQEIGTIGGIGEATLRIAGTLSGGGEGPIGYAMWLRETAPGHLQMRTQLYDDRFNRTYLTYASEEGEHFFGFGEQFSAFDMKGRRVPIWNQEQGIGRGAQPITWGANRSAKAGGDWHTTYAAVPQYLTSRNRGFFLENYERSTFDLTKPDRVQVEVWSGRATGRVLYGASPLNLIQAYTQYSGRMRALPEWATKGAIVGMQGGTTKVLEALGELQKRKTPIGAVWLQDWVGQRRTTFGKQLWWNWELDGERYPEWNAFVYGLDEQGIALMTYVNPFLADVTEKGDARRNLFREAEEQEFLVKRPDGGTYLIQNTSFSAGLVDLTNPRAWEWMKKVIRDEVIAVGARGWMADFGEALPYDAALYSGEPAGQVHNAYAELWAKLNREVIEETGSGADFMFFTRSGYTRSPQYSTLFWLGDQLVSWDRHDGIKTAVTGLLSSGVSGYAFNHSDIGGYTTITNPLKDYHRSEELLMRWMDLSAFNVVYRTHEGNDPEANAQFYTNEATLDHFARMAKVYQAWGFYRKRLVQTAAKTGAPVVRHLWLEFPDDENVLELTHEQFMVGSEFMVAPVLDAGKKTVEAYLPKGRWVHVWSGETYGSTEAGTTVTVPAPLGEPGVFYRTGSEVGERFMKNLRTWELVL